VLILARYNKDRPKLEPLRKAHPGVRLETRTVHAAKGLETEYCVIVGMKGGAYGFPSEIEDDPILDAVRSEPETYPHAEERRLFYVALTRAKRRAYVIEAAGPPSIFVEELLQSATGRVEAFGEKRAGTPARRRYPASTLARSSAPDNATTSPACPRRAPSRAYQTAPADAFAGPTAARPRQ